MSAQPPYRPPSSPPPSYRPGASNSRGLIIAAAVVVLCLVGGVGYWLGSRNSASATPTTAATTPAASLAASAIPSATAAGSVAPSASAVPSASAANPSAPSAAPSHAVVVVKTTAVPTRSPTPTPTPTQANPEPDFGYVTGATTVAGVTKITFDRALLYTGAAAVSAAKAHGVPLEDDYYIVNDNPLIRTFVLTPAAVVTGSINLSGQVASKPSTVAELEAWLAAHPKLHLPVNLTHDPSGNVTKIAEMFFP